MNMSSLTVSAESLTCVNGTLLASSLMRSLASSILYGSFVFFVVLTIIEPAMRSSTQAIPYESNLAVTCGQHSRKMVSRYLFLSISTLVLVSLSLSRVSPATQYSATVHSLNFFVPWEQHLKRAFF